MRRGVGMRSNLLVSRCDLFSLPVFIHLELDQKLKALGLRNTSEPFPEKSSLQASNLAGL